MPFDAYLTLFVKLLVAPFNHLGTAWPILPVYTTLILGELYKSKVSFGHAVGNGFVMLWAGLSWARHLSMQGWGSYFPQSGKERMALAWIVTVCCIGVAIFSIIVGLRKKDKAMAEVLGHTRFSCYFIILFYPMQSGRVAWSWTNLVVLLIFALPAWFLIYLTGRLLSRCLK